jgi:hypothetical protein
MSDPTSKENEDGTVEFSFPDEIEAKSAEKDTDKVVDKQQAVEEEIEVVDDTPPADRGRKPMSQAPEDPTEDELKSYSADAQKRIKHFTKGYHDERRAKEAAARERDEAVRLAQTVFEENKRLKTSLSQGHDALVSQTETSIKSEVEVAKRALREAHESFDAEQIADAQEKLTEAKIKLSRLQDFKRPPVRQEKTEVQTQQFAQPQQRQPVQDQKALAWNQRNTWFGQDPEMTSYVLGLHRKLVDSGVDPKSDEYYERLDTRVRQLFPENFEAQEKKPAARQSSSVVAPATRSTAPKKIVLTQTQVQLARRLGVPLDVYAKQIAKEAKE